MSKPGKLDFQEQSLVNMYQKNYEIENEKYIKDHFLLKQILHDYLSNMLIHKPDDVFEYTRQYFSTLKMALDDIPIENFHPFIICGDLDMCFLGGKVQFINKILVNFKDDVDVCVGYTSRQPKIKEENGVHHYFVSTEKMNQMAQRKEFYETQKIGEIHYGTHKKEVDMISELGNVGLFFLSHDGIEAFLSKWKCKKPYILGLQHSNFEKYEKVLRERNIDEHYLKFRISEFSKIEKSDVFDEIIIYDDISDQIYSVIESKVKSIVEKNKKTL